MYCLGVSGLPLSGEMADMIYDAAITLARTKDARVRVRCDNAEGEVTTEFKDVVFVGFSGVQFQATLDTALGTTKVSFLVHAAHLAKRPKGVWQMLTEAGWTPLTEEFVN